jgi:hypothetical protein
MRTINLALAVLIASVVCFAQQPSLQQSRVAELLSKLRSQDETVRDAALDQIRSDPAILHLPTVRSALLDLLDQNNKETDEAMRKAEEWQRQHPTENSGAGEGGEEDEFYSWLGETAASVADWNDPRQVCVLVRSGSVLDGRSPEETASHMKAAMPCIFQMSRSDVNINRRMAAEMLVKALAKGKKLLGRQTINQAEELILSNLRDPDGGVRSFTVAGLDEFGEVEMIPALAIVASSDPAIETNPDNTKWYPIRKFAADVIAEIQKRAAARN